MSNINHPATYSENYMYLVRRSDFPEKVPADFHGRVGYPYNMMK